MVLWFLLLPGVAIWRQLATAHIAQTVTHNYEYLMFLFVEIEKLCAMSALSTNQNEAYMKPLVATKTIDLTYIDL